MDLLLNPFVDSLYSKIVKDSSRGIDRIASRVVALSTTTIANENQFQEAASFSPAEWFFVEKMASNRAWRSIRWESQKSHTYTTVYQIAQLVLHAHRARRFYTAVYSWCSKRLLESVRSSSGLSTSTVRHCNEAIFEILKERTSNKPLLF